MFSNNKYLIYEHPEKNHGIIAQTYLPSKLYTVNKMLQLWLPRLMFPFQYF